MEGEKEEAEEVLGSETRIRGRSTGVPMLSLTIYPEEISSHSIACQLNAGVGETLLVSLITLNYQLI